MPNSRPAIARMSAARKPIIHRISDTFSPPSGSSAPPASVQRGTSITVDVAALEQLETDVTALEARTQAHLANAGAHQPHAPWPHRHGGGPMSVYAAADGRLGDLFEGLVEAPDALVGSAHAQQPQPPPLEVYRDDMYLGLSFGDPRSAL